MPIFSEKNLYPGINAHLNSILQNEPGGWENYHATHIGHITQAIDAALPAGYFARSEKSLQLSELVVGVTNPSGKTRPDTTIYHGARIAEQSGGSGMAVASPSAVIAMQDALDPEDFLNSSVIYKVEGDSLLGTSVARVELLSPANLPGGSHHSLYLEKRSQTLHSGLRLVEIDYLHERSPALSILPSYRDREEDAFPYMILVNDPHPTLKEGHISVYDIGIDEPLPRIRVPLLDEDSVIVDFGAIYNTTFASLKFFAMVVDYEREPPHFDRYTLPIRDVSEN